jgi:ATP-binding cassette subfamily B protein
VSFRYPGAEEDALSDISFIAEQGKTTAIIGPTGSGKSTIASVILRFYDVTMGSIAVDGADVRKVTQKQLRSKIGYVPQKSVLLSGTIAFNLKYGKKEASDGEVREATEIAQALDFVTANPERFEGLLAQGGGNVSGGQKQRLSIARALVKDPEILIFDDSFSALDFKTDALLRHALQEKRNTLTRIVIAQRVGTIMNADQILVLDKGRIIGRGTHPELLQNCPEYLEIAASQLTADEIRTGAAGQTARTAQGGTG